MHWGGGDKWQVNKPIIVKSKQWQEIEGIFHKVSITVSLANKQLIKNLFETPWKYKIQTKGINNFRH